MAEKLEIERDSPLLNVAVLTYEKGASLAELNFNISTFSVLSVMPFLSKESMVVGAVGTTSPGL